MQTEFIKLAVIFIVIMVMVLAKLKLRDAMIAAILLTVILFGIPLGDAAKLMIQSVYEKDKNKILSMYNDGYNQCYELLDTIKEFYEIK